MSAPVKVSVVIAAYNAADTLGAELDALVRQDPGGTWEVVVSDNGSTDSTATVAHAYADRLPLRVVDSSAVRGPAAARNAGAREARGEMLAFCDADDVVADGWLAAMVAELRVDAIVTGTSRRLELGTVPEDARYFDWSRYVEPFFPQLPGAGAGNLAIETQLFRDLGGFDTRLPTGEDLDLCWRAQLRGHRLGHAPQAVVVVTNREGLRATFRQHWAYGKGNRMLLRKYAHIIPTYQHLPAWEPPGEGPTSQPAVSPQRPSFAARAWRKAMSVRRPSDLSHAASRLGEWAGQRWGKIDQNIEPLAPLRGEPKVP